MSPNVVNESDVAGEVACGIASALSSSALSFTHQRGNLSRKIIFFVARAARVAVDDRKAMRRISKRTATTTRRMWTITWDNRKATPALAQTAPAIKNERRARPNHGRRDRTD